MQRLKYIFFFLILAHFSFCFHAPPSKKHKSGTRIFFGPAYGFYKINTNHTKNVVPKTSALFGIRKEIRCDKEFKTYFLVGLDYFFHGYNFKSYYFNPDSIQIYDKTFPYDYSLFIHEIDLPMQMKFSFTRENNSLYSPYIMVGYHLRYLLPGKLNITQNGNTIKKDNADLKFKNPLFYNKINSFVSVSVGWQKNSVNNSNSSFFIEANLKYGFSPYYFQKNYSPTSLYTSAVHVSLLLGIKF